MKVIIKMALFILLASNSACSQSIEDKLSGSWVLSSNYEFPDVIIFRSDHKYFVYNPNSVATESIGLTENLKSDDILIDSAYTSMTEKGTWSYSPSTKELILKERNILEEWTDFSEATGKSNELRFYLKQLTENKIEFCFDKQGEQRCDEYEKNWSYTTDKGAKVFYREITEEFSGTGSQTKEILLSGYETELKLTYEFYKEADQLVVEDRSGRELFSTDIIATNGMKTKEIPLRGVTKLMFKVRASQENFKWKIRAEIK